MPRKLFSCRPEVGRVNHHHCSETHCGLLILTPGLERISRDINHGAGQRGGNFMAASRVPGLEHCIIQFAGQHRLCTTCIFLYSASFMGYYAGRSHSQDNEGDLVVSLATVWQIKFGELGLRSQGFKLFSGDPPVLADCVVNIAKCLDGVTPWRRKSSLIQSRSSVRFRDHSACAASSCSTALS